MFLAKVYVNFQLQLYVRILFIDYSSAFNTIVPTKLITKLRTMGLNTSLCNWILYFLMALPQVVGVGNNTSSTLTMQEVVVLFTNNDKTAYREEVRDLAVWCQDNILSLDVIKTKEMIVDYRKRRAPQCGSRENSL